MGSTNLEILRPLVVPSQCSGATARAFGFLNSVDPCGLKSNYYVNTTFNYTKHIPRIYMKSMDFKNKFKTMHANNKTIHTVHTSISEYSDTISWLYIKIDISDNIMHD